MEEIDDFLLYGLPPSVIAKSSLADKVVESKIPTMFDVLSGQLETPSPDAELKTRISNTPAAPSQALLLTEPQAGAENISNNTTNIFNQVLPGVDFGKINPSLLLEQQIVKVNIEERLREMQEQYRKDEEVFRKFQETQALSSKPSAVMASINEKFDRTETFTSQPAVTEKAGVRKTPVTAADLNKGSAPVIAADLNKGSEPVTAADLNKGSAPVTAADLNKGSAPSTLIKAAGLTEKPAIEALGNYISTKIGGISPNVVLEAEPQARKAGAAANAEGTQSAATLSTEGGRAASELSGMLSSEAGSAGTFERMFTEAGIMPEAVEYGMPSILQQAGLEFPDVFKTGNFESVIRTEPLMLNVEPFNPSLGAEQVQPAEQRNSTTVRTNNPISNKSLVSNIINPPNLVEKGVNDMSRVISSSLEKTNTSIEKLSMIGGSQSNQSMQTNQTFNNTMSNLTQAAESQSIERAQAQASESEAEVEESLSSYYLQAIYDALVVQGIKIRTM